MKKEAVADIPEAATSWHLFGDIPGKLNVADSAGRIAGRSKC
ncbi:MAG: hypothetical protein JWR26_4942 [Pedosphaera sp.]|nr:hypothetical protein [Pedosphaera sp.]